MHSCDKCLFRAQYDKKPTSLLGRLWRWHIGFCPGWRKHFNSLPAEKQEQITQRYDIKTRA